MKNSMLILFLVIISMNVSGQVISGQVLDNYNQPINYATVILQKTDSSYVSGIITDSLGRFNFANDSHKCFRLIVQHLSYIPFEHTYSLSDIVIVHLSPKENEIQEVIIKQHQPVVKLDEGKLIYNMPVLLKDKVLSNVYESVLQLPGVREQNGSLLLTGANKVTVLINGQVSSMSDQALMETLKMLPPDKLKSAQVMYSAPAQYHVHGAAINLILNENSTKRKLEGQLATIYKQQYFANYTSLAALYYASSKLNLAFNYSYTENQNKTGEDLLSFHSLGDSIYEIEQENRGTNKTNRHNVRFGTDFILKENKKLIITYTGQITTRTEAVERSIGSVSNSQNFKQESEPVQLHNLLVSYESGNGFKTGVEYTHYSNSSRQKFSESDENNRQSFTADDRQEISRYRFFSDQITNLARNYILSYGVQYKYTSDHSSQIYDQEYVAMDVNSRLYEHTVDAYTGLKKTFNSLSLYASLIGEYYEFAELKQWTAFPTLEATYQKNPKKVFQLSISSNRVYADYWEIHGATSYLNSYAQIKGNPLLKPYQDFSAQFMYILNQKYIIAAFYNNLKDYFIQIPYQSRDDLVLIYQAVNLDWKKSIGVNIVVPFTPLDLLKSRFTLCSFYDYIKASDFHGILIKNNKMVLYSSLENTLSISTKPLVRFEVNGSFITESIQGPATLTKLWKLDAGVKWIFGKQKAELSLKGTDLLNSWSPDLILDYSTQNLRMNIFPDSRVVGLYFTWKFGDYKQPITKIEDSRFGVK